MYAAGIVSFCIVICEVIVAGILKIDAINVVIIYVITHDDVITAGIEEIAKIRVDVE